MAAPEPGLLLVGHGTRDRAGIGEFFTIAELVAARLPEVAVEACFLELAAPSIAEAVGRLRDAAASPLVVCPLLLFAAGHVKRDIPRAVRQAVGDRGSPPLLQAAHLGLHPKLLELSRQRYGEATAGLPPLPADEVLLLLVGRGSRDAEATAEMRSLARLRQQAEAVAEVRVAFAALARPTVEEAIEQLQGSAFRRVVVQPQLLFRGQILDKLARRVQDAARRAARQQWLVTPHLGPSPLVAECVVDRFRQALAAQAL